MRASNSILFGGVPFASSVKRDTTLRQQLAEAPLLRCSEKFIGLHAFHDD
jgi:hypothetical protein